MTFFGDLWTKLKKALSLLDKDCSPTVLKEQGSPSALEGDCSTAVLNRHDDKSANPSKRMVYTNTDQASDAAHGILHTLQDLATETGLHQSAILNNLKRLKKILEAPKESRPELRFAAIQEHLGIPESYETIRQERWHDSVYCPNCQSIHIKRATPLAMQSHHNYRYHCVSCGLEFNDDSGTPMETGLPPLHVWMQCWYLMGCTDSLTYIAGALHLDLAVVEIMVNRLRETFHTQHPLTKFVPEEALLVKIKEFQQHVKEDLLQKHEHLDANIATAPKDTTEFRRQQNLRRTLQASDALPLLAPIPGVAKRSL